MKHIITSTRLERGAKLYLPNVNFRTLIKKPIGFSVENPGKGWYLLTTDYADARLHKEFGVHRVGGEVLLCFVTLSELGKELVRSIGEPVSINLARTKEWGVRMEFYYKDRICPLFACGKPDTNNPIL